MSIFEWLFGKKESPCETFLKAVPYELALEGATVSYDGATDAGSVIGDATERGWTFSKPTRVRISCEKNRLTGIYLQHTDNPGLTFALEASGPSDAPVFDLDLSPKRAAKELARDASLHLGGGIACGLADVDSVFELSGDLRETYIPKLGAGTLQALRVKASETALLYGPALPEGLVHRTLYDDARDLLTLLELRRRTAQGDRPFRPDETSEGFAKKLAIVAGTAHGAATIHESGPKKREVRLVVNGIPGCVSLTGKSDACHLRLDLAVGDRDGAFHLRHDHQERDDGKAHDAWAESELRVFFAKNAFVSSGETRAEVRSLLSLPEETRNAIVELCTQYDCEVRFANGTLTADFRELGQFIFYANRGRSIDAAEVLLKIAAKLCEFAATFPMRGDGETAGTKDLPELTGCSFCRALFFRSEKTNACIHCGAPAGTAFHVATLESEGAR